MNVTRLMGLGLAVAGIVFFVAGLNATDSPMDQMSDLLVGKYTDRTMWYIAGGLAAAIGGAIVALSPAR